MHKTRSLLAIFLLGLVYPSLIVAQQSSQGPSEVIHSSTELIQAPVEIWPSGGDPSTAKLVPLVAEPPKYPNAKLTGFFQADMGWVAQDAGNMASVGDVQDGADFRRARLAATGDVASNVGYLIEFDFAFAGRPSFMDLWMEVRDTSFGNIKAGHFRQPIGLDGLTGVKELTFIERGLPFAFLPFRQIGVMSSSANEAAGRTFALSGFRFPVDTFGGQVGDDGGYGMASRLTQLIVDDPFCSVHLGGAYSLVFPANNAVQYRSQPEFFIAETGGSTAPVGVPLAVPPFVDTGAIAANSANFFGSELAVTRGNWHGQMEYIQAVVDPQMGSSLSFSGVSAQLACVLTGEHRPYNKKNGVLGRITPDHNFGEHGMGAIEVAGRWSYLDLNDDAITGGELQTLTFGTNWYLNNNSKVQLNYVRANLETVPNGSSNADFVVLRAQVDF